MAGSILATGKDFIPEIRKPVASIRIPPQAVKSFSISFVVSGRIKTALRNKIKKMMNCGIQTRQTINPRLAPKIAAVKKSRIDLEISMVWSPVIPDCRDPKIPVPLAQNNTIILTSF